MGFENDIMISYAWHDDAPPPMRNSEGWVSSFQVGLEYWLKQVMPRPPKIWRDMHQMPGDMRLVGEVGGKVGKSAILVTVLSESYLGSQWCRRELDQFVEAAHRQGGLHIANDYRIFKINKLPVDRDALPGELAVVTGFDFYEMDTDTRALVPIDPNFGDHEKQRFIRKLYEVAVAMAKLLKQVGESEMTSHAGTITDSRVAETMIEGAAVHAPAVGGRKAMATEVTVFIPYVTRDLRDVREDLVAELQRRNCKVIPEEQLTLNDSVAFKANTQAMLQAAEFSIHLVGTRYGCIMEGESKSVLELQNEWAATASHEHGLKRLIWIPKRLDEVSERQSAFIQKLRSDREAILGADLLEDSPENLKSTALEMIKPRPVMAAKAEEGGEHKVYLIHDENDKDSMREVRKALKDVHVDGQPLKLLLPVFDGEATSLREIQRQRILDCDRVILVWGSGSQAWVDFTLGEIRKSKAYGRLGPFRSKHLIYITSPKTRAKEDWMLDAQDGLLEGDLDLVDATAGVDAAALKQLIQSQ